jgi:transcription factor TFIIIB component B''
VSPNHFMLVSLERNPPSDMQTLSRMTGKDFSGPVPVIRAKSPPNLEPSNLDPEGAAVRKQSRTPGPTRPSKEAGTEVELGHPSNTRPGVKTAPSATSQKAKKSANDLSQDDVEVLGTIDGDWD